MIYKFENIEIDTDRFELRQDGMAQKVEPQVFALVEFLVANHDRMVSKDELNLRIWGGRVVSDAVVNSRIRSARLVIGDNGKAQRLIQTVRGRGFRFVGEPAMENRYTVELSGHDDKPKQVPTGQSTDAATTDDGPSIAVLPFQILGAGQRYEMLADAVAHEVIVELSRLHWLFVIARGSSFRFRGPNVDLGAAREVLKVRYFLTGGVAIDDRRSVVTVELVHSGDNRILWAERFEGAVDDLLELPRTIASRIVTELDFRIPMLEASQAVSLPTANLDSWSAYHRGLWHMFRFNAHDNEIAAHMFDRAITADRDFARAHAGLSFTHFQNAFVGYAKDTEAERRLARRHAEKSMALDPLDPFANLSMGRAAMLVGDLDGSRSWFDRCVELYPNYAFAIYNRALTDAITGFGNESELGTKRAMSLSPIDPLRYAMLATRALSHIVRDDHAAAVEWAEKGAVAPNAHVHIRLIAALANKLAGNREAAERWASEVRRTDPRYEQKNFFAAFPFSDEQARSVISKALKDLAF